MQYFKSYKGKYHTDNEIKMKYSKSYTVGNGPNEIFQKLQKETSLIMNLILNILELTGNKLQMRCSRSNNVNHHIDNELQMKYTKRL